MSPKLTSSNKAWVVAVDMGYGHQRAAYPLRHLSPTGQVIVANNYEGIPRLDSLFWNDTRKVYEFFSQASNLPIVGKYIFDLLDHFQAIEPFYPRRDLSASNAQVRQSYFLIRNGFGRDLINYLNTKDIPLITTFFTVAFMAEVHKFKNDIYTVICDSDFSRTWVPPDPKNSKIKFLAPNPRVVERLKLYGVREQNIFLTGFPLPKENLGGDDLKILRGDLVERLINLDPLKRYRSKYGSTVKEFLKKIKLTESHHHPFTVTFAVGGAGAQRNIADDILMSLRKKLLKDEIHLNLVAGTRNDVYRYFKTRASNLGLTKMLGKSLEILYNPHKQDYFRRFNETLRYTDILWTKPSELVFYSALGLPIIMAPPLGSQEDYNHDWLKTIGAGITQSDPRYTDEWLFDWVNSGWLAEAAMSGFLDARQFGTQNIIDVVFNGVKEPTLDNSLL